MRRSKVHKSKKEEKKRGKGKGNSVPNWDVRRGKKLLVSELRSAEKGQSQRKIRWTEDCSVKGDTSAEESSDAKEEEVHENTEKDENKKKKNKMVRRRSPCKSETDSEDQDSLYINNTCSYQGNSTSSEERIPVINDTSGPRNGKHISILRQTEGGGKISKKRTDGNKKNGIQDTFLNTKRVLTTNKTDDKAPDNQNTDRAIQSTSKRDSKAILPKSKTGENSDLACSKTIGHVLSTPKSSGTILSSSKSSSDLLASSRRNNVNSMTEMVIPPSLKTQRRGRTEKIRGSASSKSKTNTDIQKDSERKTDPSSKIRNKSKYTTKSDNKMLASSSGPKQMLLSVKDLEEEKNNTEQYTKRTDKKKAVRAALCNTLTAEDNLPTTRITGRAPSYSKTLSNKSKMNSSVGKFSENGNRENYCEGQEYLPINRKQPESIVKNTGEKVRPRKANNAIYSKTIEGKSHVSNKLSRSQKVPSQNRVKINNLAKKGAHTKTQPDGGRKNEVPPLEQHANATSNDSDTEDISGAGKCKCDEEKSNPINSSEQDITEEVNSIKSTSRKEQTQVCPISSDKCESYSKMSDSNEYMENGDTGQSEEEEEMVQEYGGNEEQGKESNEGKGRYVRKDELNDLSENEETDKSEDEEKDDVDKDKDSKYSGSVQSEESGSEGSETDEDLKKSSTSDDKSDVETNNEKEVQHNPTKICKLEVPNRKALPSGMKAKLLNIKYGASSEDWTKTPHSGKRLVDILAHSNYQNLEPEKTAAVKSKNSVVGREQFSSSISKTRVTQEIDTKRCHMFTAHTHIIRNLRRKQREAQENLLNRRNDNQNLPSEDETYDVTEFPRKDVNLEEKQASDSTRSSQSSNLKKTASVEQPMPKDNQDKLATPRSFEAEDDIKVQLAPDAQKNTNITCSVSAFRRVTGWLRRFPTKKSSIKERLASVARAIGITDWLFRTFRKRKKHKQCELKRRTALRLLSTSRLASQINQASAEAVIYQDTEGRKLERENQTEETQQESKSQTTNLAESYEAEESIGTSDAKYAIVLPRIHHLAKTMKISPAVARSARSTEQRVVASVQPATSSRNSYVDIKDNTSDIHPQLANKVSTLSSRYRSFNLMGSRSILNKMSKRDEEPVTFHNLVHPKAGHDDRDPKQTQELQNVAPSESESGSSCFNHTQEDEEIIQHGPPYEATTHVHWAQSVPERGDSNSWLNSETLLPQLTIENLSKWSMRQEIPHAKSAQPMHLPRDRWESEDTTENILQMNLNTKQKQDRDEYLHVAEVSDLSFLEDICESAILLCVKKRFHRDDIYTQAGHMLLSVNPFKSLNIHNMDMISIYQDSKTIEKPPHIFAVVEEAYNLSQSTECVPNILLSGHSGSGKTKTIMLITQYLMHRKQSGRISQLPDFLTVLESFGNCKTTLNSNSTRFGHILHVSFHRGVMAGSSVSHYLLEKSRVVFQAIGERSFHIFYELLEGLSEHEKQDLYLQEPETYYYLNQGRACDLVGKNEKSDFQHLGKCLRAIGLSDSQLTFIWAVLSAILQLGNICFTSCERDSCGSATAFSVTEIRIVASLLQISPEGLQKAITQRVTTTSYEQVLSPLSVESSIEARDSISQALYSLLFDWLLEKGNDWLSVRETDSALSIIDISGFENLGVNSLEQLCRNFANELIQYHSTQRIITQEQAEYAKEGLSWAVLCPDGVISCLEILTQRPHGIFHILEEQSELAQATDHTFLQKCHYHHGESNSYIKPKLPLPVFTLQHYAGPVTYQVHNFLNKNRSKLPPLARDVFTQSRLKLLSDLLKTSSMFYQQTVQKTRGKCPKSTLSERFQMSMQDLTSRLERNRTFVVRCITPNTKKLPGIFDVEFVSLQLRNSGIMEVAQLMKEGYPVRIPLKEFVRRYAHLAGKGVSFSDERECCAAVLTKTLGDPTTLYQIGFSKVFLKELGREILQKRWKELQSIAAVTLQKNLRGFLNRKNFQAYRHKITVVQAHVRGHQARRRYKRIKNTRVQFGAALLISRIPSIQRRNHQLKKRELRVTGQETRPTMDLTLLDVPAELAAVLNSAQLQSHYQNAQITEVPPPQVVVQSKLSLPPDIDNYPFSLFIRSYFKNAVLPPLGTPLQDPLTRVSRESHAAALELYKLALRFVGSTAIPNWQLRILGNYIAERCLQQTSLADEVLCQVASLTVQNTNDEQCQHAWLLLSTLLSCITPSPTLEKYLLKYVSDQGFEGYKAICQHKLLRSGCHGQNNHEAFRNHAPSMLEWTANERKGKMVVDVHTYTEDKYSTEVDSWTTGEQIACWLLQSRGVVEIPRGWSVSILDGDQWLDLPGNEFLLDVISEVEDHTTSAFFKSSDYLFGDNKIPEPPQDIAPRLPPGHPSFPAPSFPPAPPPGILPTPPPAPPLILSSLDRGNVPIPPAPPIQAPSLPAAGEDDSYKDIYSTSINRGQGGPQRLDNYVDQLFQPVLSSPTDLSKAENLNWRMKGGGGIGPTYQGPFNQGVGSMPSYGMPMMNGMMPAMGAMPMMPTLPAMMPTQAMMPQVMPQMMPQTIPVPAVDPTQLAAQQQAFINQQALLLAQQMTLQATMLSQQQQSQRLQDPPQQTIDPSSPPAPKPSPKAAPKPSTKAAPKQSPKTSPKPVLPPDPVPATRPAPTTPQPKPESKQSQKESTFETDDESDYAEQRRTFQQKRRFFQQMASRDTEIKPLKPPSKIWLPSAGSDSDSIEELPKPAEPEPQPDIPVPKAISVKPPPVPKKAEPEDKDPVKSVVVKKAPKPQPSREIREIIMMYQNRPQPELKPFQPVRRPANSFLKRNDPKQEALERLQMAMNNPPDPPKPPKEKPIKASSSIREKQKSLYEVFPPSFIPPPPEIQAPREAGRTLDDDNSVKSSLSKHTASVFFSYSDVSWRLYMRKELFYPKEKFTHPHCLNLLCEQIIRDTFSESGFRLTQEERKKMRDFLCEFHVGNDAQSIPEESIKKRIVIAARDNWENYFSRLFNVSLEEDSELLILGVSHRGIRLVKEVSATGIQKRHLKTLCSYSFADILSLEMAGSYSIKFCLRNEDLMLYCEKAKSLKSLVNVFMQELVKDSNHVVALRSHITDDKSLLQFKKGDIIKVLPMDGLQSGWQFGSIGGRSGLFPSHLVQPAATPDYYTVLERKAESKKEPPLLKRTISKESGQTSEKSIHGESTSPPSTHAASPPPIDVSNYTMVEFALKYFRESQTMLGWKGMAAEGRKPVEMVQHTKVPIQESLIYYTDKELNEQATVNFMTLMRFMGDQHYREQDDIECLYEILQLCREKETLRDEVYCQVLKQITENPKQESCKRGWIILSLLTGFYPPSTTLLPYVTKYLQDIEGTYKETSRNCQEHLRQTVRYYGRRHLPPRRELEALLSGRVSRRLVIFLPGEIEYSTKIKTFTVAGDLVPEICEHLMVSDPKEKEEFAIFANKNQGEVRRPLRSGEYIHDFLLQDNSVTLEFRRVTWKAKLRNRSELYVQVLFNQIHQDYMQGNFLLLSPSGKMEMQTGTVAAIMHRIKGLSLPPNKQELMTYIPNSVHNRLNLKAVHQYLMQELQSTENLTTQQAKLRFIETVAALPLFQYNILEVKRISEPGVASPCFVALNHQHLLVVENNSEHPRLVVKLQDIQSMRTMRPLDSNTHPGVELHYGSATDPHTLWVELPEAKLLYHTIALMIDNLDTSPL